MDGRAEATLERRMSKPGPNDLVFVRAGTRHNVVNIGDGPLRLIAVYAPPPHAPGTVQWTNDEADASKA